MKKLRFTETLALFLILPVLGVAQAKKSNTAKVEPLARINVTGA
ncbi:MAG TPA: hypothetical protein VN841_21880 [Bryobacteraceae bacterium]|nr:hypothetical protein [Bryobacteraceae bacterium]